MHCECHPGRALIIKAREPGPKSPCLALISDAGVPGSRIACWRGLLEKEAPAGPRGPGRSLTTVLIWRGVKSQMRYDCTDREALHKCFKMPIICLRPGVPR